MSAELVTDFERVWQVYPRKVGKGAARKAWAKLQPTPATVEQILAALVWQRQQPQWVRDGGTFIPHLSTYLHQERWLDEPMTLPQYSQRTVNSLRAIFGDDDGQRH